MTFSICEDEAYFAAHLGEMVADYIAARELEGSVTVFASGEELLRRAPADITLMDIRLPGRSGMKTARSLRALSGRCQLIFVTAYPEYAPGAFDLEPVGYLLKPVKREKLYAALDKAVSRAAGERGHSLLLSGPDGGGARVFDRDILYCEALGHRVTVYTLGGEYGFSGTLEELERRLGSGFFRCHRGCLVRVEHVMGFGDGFARVLGGGRVPVSRRRQAEFLSRLLASCRGEAQT